MGRGGRHAGYHGSNSATDNILAADARRIAEAHFARHDVRQQQQQQQQGLHSEDATRTSGSPYTVSWWKATEAVVNDIGYTIEDRFIIPATIAAIPPLGHDEDEDHASLSALIGYFMSISTLLAFAAYSRRLSNLMGGASPVMSEILFCVSHLSQVTQEQLGWSLFCSGFLTPVSCDGAAADGSGMGGSAGGTSSGGGSGGGSVGSGTNVAGGSAARRQMLNGGSGGSSGGSGGIGIGYASYSGGNVVRYLLGRRASNVLRQESLRSYLYSSFYSPAAFLVEQVCWFVLLVSFLDTVTLQRVAVASFFGNAVGWVPVYSVGALATLASALLFAFMYWIPSYEIDEAVLSVLFLQSSLHHVMSAYCASLCVTLLFAESMLLDDLRRTFVATVFSLPHRMLRLTGGHPVVARLLRGCGELRRNYLYFVDFYFFLGMMFWVSLVLMEAAAGISILGIATLLMTMPWLIGSGWGTAPMRALKDTLVYVSFYGVTAITLAHVVPSNALPFLSNAVQAAAILLFMVARCEHKQPGGCIHVLLWVGMLALYLYETVGTGRGAAWSMMWLPHESTKRMDYANAANVALRDHADPNAEAIGLLRMICVTFWQLLSKGLSDAGTQVVHFNVVVLGSMILMATTVRAVVVEGVGLSTAKPATVAGVTTPTPAASTHAAPVAAAKNRASSGAANSAAAAATAVASAAGAAATSALRGTANGAKALDRLSRTDSTRGSGANLDASEVGSPDGVDPGVLPITSEDDAVEETREKDGSTTHSPVEDEDEGAKEKAMTAEEDTSTPTTGEVVGYPPTNVLQEAEMQYTAPVGEKGEEENGENVNRAPPQEADASPVPEEAAVSAAVEATEREDDVDGAQVVEDTRDGVVGADTEQAAEETTQEEASAPAIANTAVENNDHDAEVKEEEETSNSDTATPTTDAESGVAEKMSPRDLADANNVTESASQTSRSEAGSMVPTATEASGKTGALNASKTSHSSVSADDPKKKTRREKERERKKLQQERRRASAQAEAEEKRKAAVAAAAADAAAAVEAAKTAAKAAAAPVLPVPRSQTEGFKKAAAPANGAAGAAAADTKASSLAAAEKKTPAVEAKAASPPSVKKETTPLPPRAGEAGKQDKTGPAKGSNSNSNSNSNNKMKVSPTSPSPVSSKESGSGGSAVGSKTTLPAASPPSTTAATAPAPFPLPKPRHEQVAAGKGANAALAPGSVSPAAKTAVTPAAVAAATAPAVVTASSPTAGATSPSPQLTAAEKLRRSANGAAGARDGKAVPSSTSTPASKNPATAKAAIPSPAATAAPAKTPVAAPSPSQQRQQNAPANVAGAETTAAPAVSPPPSVPLPLPRSAQSAEAVEAKKEVVAAAAAAAAAAVAPVVASTPAAAATTPTARPVHTKTDIRGVEACEPLQRAWREMEPITHVPDATLEPSVSDHSKEQEAAERAATPAPAVAEVNAAVAVTASAPPQTEVSIAGEDVDESYDLDRVLNFLKLKQAYVEQSDASSRSSSAASSRGGYRGNTFFQPESPTVSQTTRARFTTGPTQAAPEPSNNNAIGLFSTVPQPSDHGGSLHDLTAAALRISCSAASPHDTPHRISRSPQPAPEWMNRTSGSTYGDVVSDSFASGNFCPSGSSFHVFSTHPQGAAAVAAQAAAQAQLSNPSPHPQLTSPHPQLSQGGGLSSVPGTSLLRPVGTAERDETPFAMQTPPLYSKADSPPTGYFGLPPQTPPSPMSEAHTLAAPLPHMPFSVSTVSSAAAGLPPSFAEVMQMNNSSGAAGSGKVNTGTGNNGSKNSMTYVTVGGAAVGADRQQSVFARLRAVPNARGAMGEPMVMSSTPPSGGMQAMQASAAPGMTQQPIMVMMTTPEGQMALYPVVYNQPMYVMDANGMMHQAQAAAPQQVVYTTPATAAAAQAQMRGQLDGVTYQMPSQGVFLSPSPSQGSSSGFPPYSTQQQQPY